MRPWFEPKLWLYVPVSWQGWAVLVAYLGILGYFFRRVDIASQSVGGSLINLVIPFVGASVAFLLIARKKSPYHRLWFSPKRLGDALENQLQQRYAHKQRILQQAKTAGGITARDAETLLGISGKIAAAYLQELEKEGKIIAHNERGRDPFFMLP